MTNVASPPTDEARPGIVLRPANERGRENHGWLDSRHTFSFADYYDPRHPGHRALRVINEDRVQAGGGFPPHSHRDMEILSYVLEGALEHRDSLGNGALIRPGEVQRMTAGRGVRHSEYNASRDEPVHFLQIWLLPDRRGLEPGYEQRAFPESERRGRLRLVASRGGHEGSVMLHQDACLYSSLLSPGQAVLHELAAGRYGWLQVASGELSLNGLALSAGDGAAIFPEASRLSIEATTDSHLLLFDLA